MSISNIYIYFQNRFDNLYRQYITYSGGEELFGLPVTEYDELLQIRKELNLLQKLYSLYNDVIVKVNGYFEIPWIDVNIDRINMELQEFQTRLELFSVSKLEFYFLSLFSCISKE